MEARRTTFSVAKHQNGATPQKKAPNSASRRVSESPASATNSPALDASRKHKGERVKVFVRVRPTKPGTETSGALQLNPDSTSLAINRDDHYMSEFGFDSVLGPSATQADVYDAAAAPVVADVLRGYNATLLAYGQTGAGKTHTLGCISPDAVGIIPRAAAEIFSAVAADPSHVYSIHMSYLQIYCELLQDLLCPESGDNLPIREGEGGVVHVPGLKQVEVSSLDECLRLLQLGDRNRAVAFTALNAHSSRSHAVVMLSVVKRRRGAAITKVQVGKLFMVDLAGSERLKKSLSTGQRASEARAINLSLTTLGMCVSARASGTATHVPFRDSKLTRLLQESLGGNARTSMVIAACDAKEHADETLQSLQFGARAMRVETHARVNEKVDYSGANADEVSLAAALAGGKGTALERSLLEREHELEEVQAALTAEQERSRQVVESLQKERSAALARAAALEEQHEEQLKEQHAQRTVLHDRATAAERIAEEAERRRAQDLEAMAAELEYARAEAAAAAQSLIEQQAAWEQQSDCERARMMAEREQKVQEWEQRLVEAQAAAKRAAERHETEMKDLRKQWAVERDAVEQMHLSKIAQIESYAAEAAANAREKHRALESQLESVAAAAAAGQAAAGERLQREQADWEQRLQEAANALEAKEREATEMRTSIRRQELKLAQTRAVAQKTHELLKAAESETTQLKAHVDDLQKRLRDAEKRTREAEASRAALASSLLDRRRVHRAACVIQRAWRAHCMRSMQRQRVEGFAALHEAQSALGTLAAQHAELEARRHANLAFAGQTLVAESLGVLHEAVEGLMSEFLLPSKDLKAVQRFRQKRAAAAAAATPAPILPILPPLGSAAGGLPKSVNGGGGGVGGGGGFPDAASDEFIRAFNPLTMSGTRTATQTTSHSYYSSGR